MEHRNGRQNLHAPDGVGEMILETTATHSHAWIHGISEEHAIQTWRRLKDAGALQDGRGTFEDLTVSETALTDSRTQSPLPNCRSGIENLAIASSTCKRGSKRSPGNLDLTLDAKRELFIRER